MPTNRITDDCTPDEREAASATTATVRAYQVYMWRCPSCGKARMAEKSSTHREHCTFCGHAVLVEIRR